jgi:glycosyltransferase involved in cell wall biosynthesis
VSRVLHVTDAYLPRLGGIEVQVSDLVREQRARGVEAEVATITPAGGATDPAYVHRLAGGPVGATRRLARLMADEPYDAAHMHVSVWSPFASLAARRLATAGVPTLVTIHSLWSRLGPLPATARELLRLRAWPMAWSAVSDAAAEPLRQMLGPDIPVAVLGNAIDVSAWHPTEPRPAESRTAVPGGEPLRILSVMRLTHLKRSVPLAKILHRVRERVPAERALEAVVVGEGSRAPAMRRVLARHDDDRWVRMPGRLDRPAIRELLTSADVFVAPAELESFGIAALEARAAGVPVVASAWGGVGDFVKPGVEGLLGRDDDELVAALVGLLTDDALRHRIAEHNRLVAPAHDWELACEQAEALYQRAAEECRRPAGAWSLVLGGTTLR